MTLSLFSVTLEMNCVHWKFLSLTPLPHALPFPCDLTDTVTFVLFIVHSGNKFPLS